MSEHTIFKTLIIPPEFVRFVLHVITTLRPLKNADFCSSSRKAIILTTGIHRVFRGLKFEPDAEIGQKGAFCKGLTLLHAYTLAEAFWL